MAYGNTGIPGHRITHPKQQPAGYGSGQPDPSEKNWMLPAERLRLRKMKNAERDYYNYSGTGRTYGEQLAIAGAVDELGVSSIGRDLIVTGVRKVQSSRSAVYGKWRNYTGEQDRGEIRERMTQKMDALYEKPIHRNFSRYVR